MITLVGGDWNMALFSILIGNVIIPTDDSSIIFQRGRAKNHQAVIFLGRECRENTRIRMLRMLFKASSDSLKPVKDEIISLARQTFMEKTREKMMDRLEQHL